MKRVQSRVIFVTGTDTGAGKTVLTALLLAHLRGLGINALAMKPFCSGDREDVRILQDIQNNCIADSRVNPFYFKKPIAPWAEMRKTTADVRASQLKKAIAAMKEQCDVLLIEGAGGLMSPMGRQLDGLKIVKELQPEVLVAGKNRLGCLNHFFLTVLALKKVGVKQVTAVLMEENHPDMSSATNAAILRERAVFIGVFEIPYLGKGMRESGDIKKSAKKIEITLAHISKCGKTSPAFTSYGESS